MFLVKPLEIQNVPILSYNQCNSTEFVQKKLFLHLRHIKDDKMAIFVKFPTFSDFPENSYFEPNLS